MSIRRPIDSQNEEFLKVLIPNLLTVILKRLDNEQKQMSNELYVHEGEKLTEILTMTSTK